jgi:hypothetical protein
VTGHDPSGINVLIAIMTFFQRGALMQALQSHGLLASASSAMDQLQGFLHQRRDASAPVEAFERVEQARHRFFVAAERAALAHELARVDLEVPQVEIAGER